MSIELPVSDDPAVRASVLIVDDSPSIRLLLAGMLKDQFAVLTAADGEAGLIAFRRNRPDIVVLDLNMPGMSGLEVIRRIRREDRDEDVYILVLTADERSEVRTEALNEGANDYLAKPMERADLLARLGVARRQTVLTSRLRAALKALHEEMDMVASLQRRLLPGASPRMDGVKIGSFYQPSGRASGDYYDFFPVGDRRLRCVVADVSGSGARAAFIMAIVRSLLRVTQRDYHDLSETLTLVNAQLCQILGKESDFVTMLAVDVDLEARSLEYVNAGHCPAVLRGCEGQLETLTPTAPLLGFFDIDFQARTLPIWPRSRLLLYTDGLYEWEAEPGEILGLDRFVDLAAEVLAEPGPALDRLMKGLSETTKHVPRFKDDLTALWIELEA